MYWRCRENGRQGGVPMAPVKWRKAVLLTAGAGGAGLRGAFAGRGLGSELLVPFLDFGDDVVHFRLGEFGEHREADTARGIRFGVGDAADDAGLLAPRVTGLLVDGD